VLELGRARGETERRTYADQRAGMLELCKRTRTLDEVVSGLGLEEGARLEDDVALLLVRRKETR
jgi:hypothetical protein